MNFGFSILEFGLGAGGPASLRAGIVVRSNGPQGRGPSIPGRKHS
jgi:hypothetical protein